MTPAEFNALPEAAARDALTACCAAPRWVERMLGARPVASRAAMLALADTAWSGLPDADTREAIAHHPRIGDTHAAATGSPRSSEWSAAEQSGARSASDVLKRELADGNAAYAHRFGHAFIICATGLSTTDILAALRARLGNDPGAERAITSEELRRITLLRVGKLIQEP
jgi:2-oxo-4-hydroxy-4-carboxy-5-ureidoimidazoline decarboxylase